MDLVKLAYFVAVADDMHFARAAERLYVTPSAVSVGIRTLERQLGLELFERSSRRVELTDAGRALLPEARELLRRHEALRVAVRRQRDLRRRAPAYTIGVHDEGLAELTPRLLSALRTALPGIDLRVTALDYTQLPTALADGLADVLLGAESLVTDDDDFVPAYRDLRVTQLSADSEHAAADTLTVADVIDLPMLAPPEHAMRFGAPYYLLDQRNGEQPRITSTVASSMNHYLLATALDGVVQHPNAAGARFFPHAGVRYVPLVDAPALTFGAVFPSSDRSVVRRDVESVVRVAIKDGHQHVAGTLPVETGRTSGAW